MIDIDHLKSRVSGSPLARWFHGREAYEQRVVLVIGAMTLLSLLWLGIWKPISDWREVETNRFQNAKTTIDWMRANEARAREIAAMRQGQGGDRSLIPVITRSAELQQLQLTRLQPEASGAVSVVLQGQSFNDIIRWLNQLEQNNGIQVARISFDADPQPGRVNAQIRFQ